jgi:hypothetical protein
MSNSAIHDDSQESLSDFLTRRARGLSDRRLAIDASAGLLIAAAAAVFEPPGWLPLVGAATAIAASGVWGIFDRELAERQTNPGARLAPLRVGRVVAAVFGGAGVVLLLLSLLAVLLGTWIS